MSDFTSKDFGNVTREVSKKAKSSIHKNSNIGKYNSNLNKHVKEFINDSSDEFNHYEHVAMQSAIKSLSNVEKEMHHEYHSKTHTRELLLHCLIWYIVVVFILSILFMIFYKYMGFLKPILGPILVGSISANVIGLLAIVFKYAFTSSDKYYKFASKMMNWEHQEHELQLKYNKLNKN